MTGNDLDNNFKAQPIEKNEEELMMNNNNIKPENKDADDEPIYAISDFEGRFDYYIRFFTDIGFLDKNALLSVIKYNIDKSSNTKEEKDEELKMLKMFFDEPDEWFKKAYYRDKRNNDWCKVESGDDICKINCQRLNFLTTHLNADVLKQAINKDFKGKIVINGDLYSSRVNFLFDKNADNIISINQLCFDLFDAIKKDNNVKNNLILVAGNHDVYHMDYADGQYYDSDNDDILKNIKNSTLPYLKKWFKVKTKNGKMLIFKHSPRLMEDETFDKFGKDLSEIIDGKNDSIGTGLNEIIKYNIAIENDPGNSGFIYQYYFYDGFEIDKITGQEKPTFNKDDDINKKVKTMLTNNRAKLVVGHCHAGGKIKDGCICIDDDGKYKYRVFHFEEKKDISNDENNIDDECNSLNSTRESIYFDDIQYDIMPSVSANNLNYNNNNQKKSNINNGQLKSTHQDNRKKIDEDKTKKLHGKDVQLNHDKTTVENNMHNGSLRQGICQEDQNAPSGSRNPIFKIKAIEKENKDKKGTFIENNDANSANSDTNKAQHQPININDGHDGQKNNDNCTIDINTPNLTFGHANTVTFNQPQPQNKKVSCEMVKKCLSSMGECFNCKCG